MKIVRGTPSLLLFNILLEFCCIISCSKIYDECSCPDSIERGEKSHLSTGIIDVDDTSTVHVEVKKLRTRPRHRAPKKKKGKYSSFPSLPFSSEEEKLKERRFGRSESKKSHCCAMSCCIT